MKTLNRSLAAAALIAATSLQLACGGSDDNKSDAQIREVQIQGLAAYACMPQDLRRTLRALEKRHDDRVAALARANLPKGSIGGATPPAGFQQTVESDPVRQRLLRRARAIYRRFSPGGADYDAGCYLREREKARRTLENQGGSG